MKLTLEVDFKLGATVYHRIDPDVKGMITGYVVRPGSITYCVVWAAAEGEEATHYAMELTDSPEYTTPEQ